jgi:hypothetical protein
MFLQHSNRNDGSRLREPVVPSKKGPQAQRWHPGKDIFRMGRNHYFFFATVRLSHKRITGLAIKIVE